VNTDGCHASVGCELESGVMLLVLSVVALPHGIVRPVDHVLRGTHRERSFKSPEKVCRRFKRITIDSVPVATR